TELLPIWVAQAGLNSFLLHLDCGDSQIQRVRFLFDQTGDFLEPLLVVRIDLNTVGYARILTSLYLCSLSQQRFARRGMISVGLLLRLFELGELRLLFTQVRHGAVDSRNA